MELDFLTPQEVAPILRVSKRHVLRMAERKELPAIRLGRGKKTLWRFNRAELVAWLQGKAGIHV